MQIPLEGEGVGEGRSVALGKSEASVQRNRICAWGPSGEGFYRPCHYLNMHRSGNPVSLRPVNSCSAKGVFVW